MKTENALSLISGLVNEWRFLRRQPLLWATAFATLGFATLLSQGLAIDEMAPAAAMQLVLMTLQLLIMPAIVAALAPLMLLKDRRCNMAELIAATPQSGARLLFIQAAGLFVLCFLLMLLAGLPALGVFAPDASPQAASALTGNINTLQHPWPLLWVFAEFHILWLAPNLLLWTGLALWLCRQGSSVTLYVTLSLIMFAYLYLCSLMGSPVLAGSQVVNEDFYHLMLWLDPMNFVALTQKLGSGFNQSDLNSAGFTTEQAFVLNRLLVLAMAAGLWWRALVAMAKPSAQQRAPGTRPNNCCKEENAVTDSLPVTAVPPQITALDAKRSGGEMLSGSGTGRRLLALYLNALGTVVRERLDLALLGLWLLFCANEVTSGLTFAEPLARLISPGSIDALNRIMFDLVPVGGSLLLTLFGWQVATGASRIGFGELIAATAVKSRELIAAQWLALVTLALLLPVLAAFVTLIVQLLFASHISGAPYLLTVAVRWLSLALWGGWVLGVCHLLRSPLAAAGSLLLMLVIKYSPLMAGLGLSHPLWNFTNIPLQPGDDFWGYGASLATVLPYSLLWLTLTLAILVAAGFATHRGGGFRPPAARLSPVLTAQILAVAVITLLVGHSQLIAEKPLLNTRMSEQWRADYEHQYLSFADKPALKLTHLEARVDFFPGSGNAVIELEYLLVNPHQEPVETLLIGRYGNYVGGNNEHSKIEVDDASLEQGSIEAGPNLGQQLYRWHTPVAPNDSRRIRASLHFRQPDWWPANNRHFISKQLSYLRAYPLIPMVGYQYDWQLADPKLRQKHGLTRQSRARPDGYDWISISSTVSSCDNQTPLAQGRRIDDTQAEGRRTVRYQTRGPIHNLPAWMSVAAQPSRSVAGEVEINIFAPYLPEQTLALHSRAMTDTLNWFAANISSYRGDTLSLVAFPELAMSGYALPQMILLSDKLGFRAEPEADAGFDQRYRRTVHETAHQWFGHDLGNGTGEQNAFLVESITKYLELVLIEERYGTKAMEALVAYEAKRYREAERSELGKDLPLIHALSSHQQYSAATLVFASLRSAMGDEPILATLRSLWQNHGYPRPPARAEDFVAGLIGQQPEHRDLISRLFLMPTGVDAIADARALTATVGANQTTRRDASQTTRGDASQTTRGGAFAPR